MTVKQATDLYLAEARQRSTTSQHTYQWHVGRIIQYWGESRDLRDVTRRDCQVWVNTLVPTMRPASVRHLVSAFTQCYRLAWDHGAEVSPPTGLRLPRVNNKRERVLTREEEARLAAQLTLDEYSVVAFALHTGMRRLEQWRLRTEDLDLKAKGQTQTPAGSLPLLLGLANIRTSKTGRPRKCPLNPVAALIAQRWARESRDGYLFPGGSDRLAAATSFTRYTFGGACRRAGITGLHWHDLRHTCATRALEGGARPEHVQRLLGHESITQTERYMHWESGQLWPAALALVGQ